MNRDMERYKEFSRRTLLIIAGQAALFGVLATRLAYLQIHENARFQTLSDKNRISLRLVAAARGEIMDRFGVPLAINTQNFRAFLVPEQTDDVEAALDHLSKIIPVTDADKQAVLLEMGKYRPFTPILVKDNLTWNDMAAVELNLPELPGVFTEEGEIRSYPLNKATAHLIGYVGRVSEAEITDDLAMSVPGFRIGKSGIEKKFDTDLRGTAGQIREEVNVVGRAIRELSRTEPKNGDRLTLTLDADLQMQVQERLSQARSASAIVMDANTGEVYALCSYPSFDPNLFSSGIPAEVWEDLLADETNPFTNKAIAGQYPPGSTYKPITAMAVQEMGISPAARVFCPGFYMLGKDKFHCWRPQGHGLVDMHLALMQSCDTFFYEMGRRIGVDAIAAMARRLGLGARTDFDLPGEVAGIIPDRAWKLKLYGQEWQQGETLISAIGQGYTLTTPLQLATMTARLVNGGFAVKPLLMRSSDGRGSLGREWKPLNVSRDQLNVVINGMTGVVNNPRGAAYASRIKEKPYSMGGKTGTAQVRRITQAQRSAGVKNEDLPWKFRDHALFVGFGPVENPKYVVAVVVEHGGSGRKAAAPIARDLLLAAQLRDPAKIRYMDASAVKKTGPRAD